MIWFNSSQEFFYCSHFVSIVIYTLQYLLGTEANYREALAFIQYSNWNIWFWLLCSKSWFLFINYLNGITLNNWNYVLNIPCGAKLLFLSEMFTQIQGHSREMTLYDRILHLPNAYSLFLYLVSFILYFCLIKINYNIFCSFISFTLQQ